MPLSFLQSIKQQAVTYPQRVAIQNDDYRITYQQLMREVGRLRAVLKSSQALRIAVALPNCPAWIALDLAAALEQVTFIPVPHFFTPEQIHHLISDANVDTIISGSQFKEMPGINAQCEPLLTVDCFGSELDITRISGDFQLDEANTHAPAPCKISYTSGTSGAPKGVLISAELIDKTVHALVDTLDTNAAKRHLSILPFSLLLENIAGIYAVLSSGGCCHVPTFSSLGMAGSSSVDWQKFAHVIQSVKPTSMIAVPALLRGIIYSVENLALDISALKMIALGGAPISKSVLAHAQRLNLPVFQGYGMTECGSVVCLNTPDNNRIGSVGKPLPHVTIRIDAQGEIIIGDSHFSGYTHQSTQNVSKEWATGDLGYFDEAGYLYVTARKSSTYSTAFGRNIAPEWVECELDSEAAIAQSAVFGEGRNRNIAIIVPIAPTIENTLIDQSIERANTQLPDYARIANWARASGKFDVENGQLSASNTLKRAQIYTDYQDKIETLFTGAIA